MKAVDSCIAQRWSYRTERGARRFFERRRQSLRWQRLAPYQTFVRMIERHRDGIAACCKPEDKVSLGLVEGLNDKIRVIQRSAYGYRDEDYLMRKIIAGFLPPLPENAQLHPHGSAMSQKNGLNGQIRGQASRCTWNPANDCEVGISSSRLMLRCGGRVATQKIASAMSSAVIGWAPA